ncbi:hypothetical protein Poly51_41680 [Rubripirellula tenax]|uniref:Glycosyltransferase 61 catalytic domain-containing protein n=2 Tax=Rubripirellula tenax TaxID=2528015 RepID=A0A5C6EQF9_9BACT|nr:hypothetical protein Poly51_41680 [Rubripirellula tenax]
MFAGCQRSEVPAATIVSLDDVEAFGRGPLRHRKDYLDESFVSPSHAVRWKQERGHWRAAAERLIQSKTLFDTPCLWITDNWSSGYFHWMCDSIPRLEMASMVCDLSEMTLLLPYKFRGRRYIQQSLAPYGLKDVRILKRFERACCRRLTLPSHVASTGNFDQGIIGRMRNRFLRHLKQHADGNESTSADRVYISRRVATRRKIANEDAVETLLKNHGFKIVVCEQMQWIDQLSAVTNAECLVSNHGAGLTNMIAMQPGRRVLEIRDAVGSTPNCYFNLAAACSLGYFYSFAHRTDPQQTVHHGDVTVDVSALDQAIHAMVGENIGRHT